MVPPHVDLHVVATVVSGWTGSPVGKMLAGNLDAVSVIRERMTARLIVGQGAVSTDTLPHPDLPRPSRRAR